MFKKIILASSVFALSAFAFASSTFASNIFVDWNNSQNKSSDFSLYKGSVAKVEIKVTNNDGSVKKLWIEEQTYSCNKGATAEKCFDNGKAKYETVSVQPGQTITRSVSRATPQATCGSAQVDYFVSDITDGVKRDRQGPFWDLAYTGKDCKPPEVPACPPRSLVRSVDTDDALKKLTGADVAYRHGIHWIYGWNPARQRGADLVFFRGLGSTLAERKRDVLQCFYPANGANPNVKTNFIIKGGTPPAGWLSVSVQDAIALNLLSAEYWAKSVAF